MGMETGQVSAQVWIGRTVVFTGAEGITSGQDGRWARSACATLLPALQWKYCRTELWGVPVTDRQESHQISWVCARFGSLEGGRTTLYACECFGGVERKRLIPHRLPPLVVHLACCYLPAQAEYTLQGLWTSGRPCRREAFTVSLLAALGSPLV